MSRRSRVRKVVFWVSCLLLAIAAGTAGLVYKYMNDSDTLSGLIRAEAPRYLPKARLELGKVRLGLVNGEVNLTQVHVRQAIDGASWLTLRIPWLQIQHDPRALLKRRFVPRKVVVAQPTLRLCRRGDGTWNIQDLLADPWPGPPMKGTPSVVIQNGTVELADAASQKPAAILRDVAVEIEPAGPDRLTFVGSAKGDAFERLSLQGTIDRVSGKVTLGGDLGKLALSETLRARLPAEFRPATARLGLVSGEVDLSGKVVYDPSASPKVRYEGSARVRSGDLNCPKLPFPINELSASVSVRDGVVTIERAEGFNGPTKVRVKGGRVALGDPARAPFDLSLEVTDLELDRRLRDKTPPEFAELWRDYSPSGRVSAAINLVREREGGPVGFAWSVNCLDVAMTYRYFPYPVEHVRGLLSFEKKRITLNLQAVVGNKPLTAKGTIDDPGPLASVVLDFDGEALPIDKTLFDALPPPIRKVVADFKPSGTVRGKAHVARVNPARPADQPKIHADLDLNEGCAMQWVGMPYPVGNLTGHLELHPDLWTFRDMRGENGQAVITGSGRVEKLPGPGDPLKVDLDLEAKNLDFNKKLRDALPPAWKKTWERLNPLGSSDVEAKIEVRPGAEHYNLVIVPKAETLVQLSFTREPGPGDPGGTFDLRMENVRGRFVYNDGLVTMKDVGFVFHGSPVSFAEGAVQVENSGRFNLGVSQVWARNLRLDGELRKMMPPVMAQFAQRLDDGRPIATVKGDLHLAWPGPGQAILCEWQNGLVVLNGNTIQAGIPLEHLQGELRNVKGQFQNNRLGVQGIIKLDSIGLLGQQVTNLETPFRLERGEARLTNIRGNLLGGTVSGSFDVSLSDTPRYAAALKLEGADLQQYAMTLPGRQSFRGLVFGNLSLNGLGNDLHTLQGQGEARIVQGDLGEMPVILRAVRTLTLSSATRTLFDSAEVGIVIRNGESTLDPIRLTGDAFSLLGRGTMDIQGNLNLRFKPLYGRERFRLPVLSDAMREAGGQLFVIRARGPVAFPRFDLEALPRVSDALRSGNLLRGDRDRDARAQ